jgi:FkbM family methyltransferase
MNPSTRRKGANFLRGILGIEGFDRFSLGIGMNSHFNSNLEEMRFLKSVFSAYRGSDSERFTLIDAGANRGLWAEAFCRNFPVVSAHLFEPNPNVAFRFFRKNIQDLHRNCFGLSSSNGSAEIRISKYPGVTSSIGKNSVYEDSGETRRIDLKSLDSYFQELGRSPEGTTVLKVDVEGHDLEVLEGAAGLFRDRKIHFVVIEIGFNPVDDCHIDFLTANERMKSLGLAFCGFSEQFCVPSGSFFGMQWGNAVFALQKAAP